MPRLSSDGNGKPLVIEHKSDNTTGAATLTWTMTYDAYGPTVDRVASTANLPTGLTFYGTDRQQFAFDDLGLDAGARHLELATAKAMRNVGARSGGA